MTVTQRSAPAVPLAVMARIATPDALPRLVPETCGRVWQALQRQGVRGGRHVAVYWDDVIHCEIGVEIDAPFAPTDGLIASQTPAGPVATMVHYGPYGTLGLAHAVVRAWCAARDLTLAGPRWEVYAHWDDAWTTQPERIETTVHYLLAER